jgi:uncharacterized membrane protein
MDSQDSSRPTEFDAHGGDGRTEQSGSLLWTLLDLLLVVVLAAVTLGLAYVFGEQGGPLAVRVPLGFLFVFVLPGYALAGALFPATSSSTPEFGTTITLSSLERGVLSVGLSLVLVPLVSIALTMFSISLGLYSVLFSLGTLTIALSMLAAVRRLKTPPAERYSVNPRPAVESTIAFLRADAVNAVLAVSLVLAVGGVGAALVTAEDATTYTEFAVLGDDGDGEPTAGAYPTELSVGETEPLHVEIANHERQAVEYTVVVLVEEFTADGERIAASEYERFTVELDHAERTVVEHQFEPVRSGENVRLSYLLYLDGVPAEPTPANAHRSTHLTLTVTE